MQKDKVQAFMFKNRAVRGCFVRLNESYQTITMQHHYPEVLSKLLGEALLGVTLMSSHLKQQGQTTLQFQGEGALNLLSVRITPEDTIRGLIRANPELISLKNLTEALHHGQLTLSHEGIKAGHNYQSIIPVEEPSIAKALEEYFVRSEQLPTRFFLATTDRVAAGLLLQIMPGEDPAAALDDFQHATVLAETLRQNELLTLDCETILTLLYNEDDVELFAEKPVHFGCNCTLEKMQAVIRSLGRDEADSIIAEQAFVEVVCEFCSQIYQFGPDDIQNIFEETAAPIYH